MAPRPCRWGRGQAFSLRAAAKKFLRKLLKRCRYVPRVIITDKLESYGATKRKVLSGVEHRQSRYLNKPCRELAPADTQARVGMQTSNLVRSNGEEGLGFVISCALVGRGCVEVA